MRRRRGITLIEVLVAIFIMAIGLLAILTLFPLGALRMSESLQSDRTAASASAAANICDAFGIRNDPQYDPPPAGVFPIPPYPIFATSPTPGYQPAAQVGGGYAVFVDPYGVVSNGPGPYGTFGGVPLGASTQTNPPTPGIWRVSPSAAIFPATGIPEPGGLFASAAARYFTLPDDMTFGTNGAPDTSSGVVQRGGRYTWGYLLHRSNPYVQTSPVDLTVVVYAGRSTAVPSGEATYPAAGAVNSTSVTLTYAGATPNIRRGGWILDTSYNPTTSSVHGDFYRVVAVTQPAAGQLQLELQTPISNPDPNGVTAVTVMDNVVDVFERGFGDTSTNWEFRTELGQ